MATHDDYWWKPCRLCGTSTNVYFEEFPVCVNCEMTRPDDMWALLEPRRAAYEARQSDANPFDVYPDF